MNLDDLIFNRPDCLPELSAPLFKSILDALPQHIALLDDQFIIMYVNRAWKRFGDDNGLITPDYGVGQDYMALIRRCAGECAGQGSGQKGEDAGCTAPEMARQLDTLLAGDRDGFSMEYACHSPDQERWFRVTFTRVTVGGRRWIVNSHENITRLWKTNLDLIKNDHALQGIIASIPDPMCMLDRSLKIVWSNDRAREMFGEDILSKPCLAAYSPAPSLCGECIVRSTFADGRVHTQEMQLTDRQGRRRTFQCRTSLAGFDDQGKPDRVMEILQDITEQKQMEDELRRLSKAVEYSPVSVVITDTRGTIQYVNPKFAEVTGYTAEEAIGQNPKILGSGKTDPAEYRSLWQTITRGRTWHGEFINRKKNGDLYWEAASISPILDDQGRIIHYVAVKEDITGQKRMIRQLETAKNQAEAATRAKTSFLATMSHEIRTPMNAILGMSKLVLGTALDDTQHRYLSSIYDAADSLLAIIDDILDLTRIEGQTLVLNEKQFQLGTIIDNIFTVIKYTIQDKNLELIYRHDHQLPLFLVGDTARISQILMNLVSNAVKYTPEGLVTVTSESFIDDDGAHILGLRVADTGIGMSEEQIGLLFQPFCQLDSSTSRKYGGTGLGLVIVKKMVELMGGRITVESRPGKGAVFSVFLPLKKLDPGHLSSRRIKKRHDMVSIIVSPDTPARQALLSNLTHLAMSAVTADHVQEAVDLTGKQPGEILVLLDWDAIDSSAGDGAAAAGTVSRLWAASGSAVHLLIMHDHKHRGHADQLRQSILQTSGPVATCIEKPITPMRFLKTVTAILEKDTTVLSGESGSDGPPKADSRPAVFTGKTILVVDDDAVNREIVTAFLEKTGASVFEAGDGRAAVEMAGTMTVDVILMDIEMPGMDGLDTTRKIREMDDDRPRNLPIIGLTGHALDEFRDQCLAAGMNGFLTKPVRQDDLYAMIQHWLAAAAPADDAASAFGPGRCLNPEKGLDYAGQNHGVYIKMLNAFIAACREFQAELDAFTAELDDRPGTPDTRRIKMQVHKFKSSAAMVGADRLAALSRQIDAGLSSPDGPDTDLQSAGDAGRRLSDGLRPVREELDRVTAAVRDYLDTHSPESGPAGSSTGPAAAPGPLSPDQAGDLITDLVDQIDRHRPVESLRIIEALRRHTGNAAVTDVLDQVRRLVDTYRFKDARTVAGQLAGLMDRTNTPESSDGPDPNDG